jgi:hypothetical protein
MTAHDVTFFRAGGFDQVLLAAAPDIAAIGTLDRTLWAALACPVQGLEFDERTLALIDTDGDGRVRAPEIVAAVAFVQGHLKDLASVLAGRPRLALVDIDDARPAGRAVLGCARRVLERVGKTGAADIGLEEIAAAAGDLAKTRFNGDGVLPPAAAGDAALQAALADILACGFGATDRAGEPGVDRAALEAFAAEGDAFLAWWRQSEERPAEILPLGPATVAAAAAVLAVRAKVDDFFLRCDLAAVDAAAATAVNRSPTDIAALAARDLTGAAADLAALPLARAESGRALPLRTGINPAWTSAIARLRDDAVTPILGARDTLDASGWERIRSGLSAHLAWLDAKTGARVERLGAVRVHALLAPALRERLLAIMAEDDAVRPEFEALRDLEKLVRLHRDLCTLLRNFVNFSDLYDPALPAIFQAGTLYIDGRACDLCVRVGDMARHGQLAGLSKTYLLYCDCTRAGARQTICAAVTHGSSDGLLAGRNGLFIDRQGRDWDATVVKVVENPISIREAFWSPYKRAVRFVEEFISKRAAEADRTADATLQAAATAGAQAATAGKAAAPKPKIDIGTVAALGVAVGGITAAIGALLNALFGLGYWVPLGVVGLVLLISGPSMVLAWLKLRQRSLGPILDASGWAVNGNVRINIPFGAQLTRLATVPLTARRIVGDPYAERSRPWGAWLALIVTLALAAWAGWDRYRQQSWCWQRWGQPDAAARAYLPEGQGSTAR